MVWNQRAVIVTVTVVVTVTVIVIVLPYVTGTSHCPTLCNRYQSFSCLMLQIRVIAPTYVIVTSHLMLNVRVFILPCVTGTSNASAHEEAALQNQSQGRSGSNLWWDLHLQQGHTRYRQTMMTNPVWLYTCHFATCVKHLWANNRPDITVMIDWA